MLQGNLNPFNNNKINFIFNKSYSSSWEFFFQATSTSQLFFARKFEAIINQAIINKVEEWVYGPPSNSVNLLGYWQSIYHQADLTPQR